MLHRSIKLAYSALLVFSVLAAFVVMYRIDSYRVIGPSYELFVSQTDRSVAGDRAVGVLQHFSRKHHVNVGMSKADLTRPDSVRHFYLSVGDHSAPSTRWLRKHYPAFNPDVQTKVHDIADAATVEPGGFYYVFGTREQAEQFRMSLTQAGFVGTVQPSMSLGRIHDWFWNGALKWCALLVVATTVAFVGLGVCSGSRSYAIQRLQGRSLPQILLRDIAQLARFLVTAISVVAVSSLGMLFLYNRLHQIIGVVLVFSAVSAIFAAVALTTQILVLVLVNRVAIGDALRGKLPGGWVISSAYLLRVTAIMLVLVVVMSGLALWEHASGLRASRHHWAIAGDAVRVTLNGTVGDKLDAEAKVVGGWLHQEDRAGHVIIAVRQQLREVAPSNAPAGFGEVLKVNDAYLDRQPVFLASGQRARATAGRVQVLVPPSHGRQTATIAAGVTEWVAFMSRISGSPLPGVTVSPMAPRQKLFSYGSGITAIDNPLIKEPVVIVLPREASLLKDEEYASYATSSSVIFPDPGIVTAAREDTQMAAYINGAQPVGQRAAEEYRDVMRDFRLHLVDLAVGLVLVVVTGVGISVAFCRKNAQRIFAQFVCGLSFARTYRRLLAWEAAVAGLVVAWVGWDTVSRLQLKRAGIPERMSPSTAEAIARVTGLEPVVTGAVAVVGLCCTCVGLAVVNRRILRERAADV